MDYAFLEFLRSVPRDTNPPLAIRKEKLFREVSYEAVPGKKIDGVWHYAWGTENVFDYGED